MKKALLIFAALIGLMAQARAYDFSSVASTGQTLYYNISGNNVSLTYPGSGSSSAWTGYTKPTGDLTIPYNVSYNGNNYIVTTIGDNALIECTGLTSVTIPSTVTSIGGGSFSGCTSLTSINIPSSVTSIGGSAFFGCTGLTSITIPNSVTTIEGGTFSGCTGLTSVTIPNSVTTIGGGYYAYGAFYGCSSLTSVTIPNSVTSIGENAFRGCSALASVTIPNSVTSLGNGAFYGCSGLNLATIGNSITTIGEEAFRDCSSLVSVTIGSSVTSIGNNAFYYCGSLTSVTIPNSVTSIGSYAFNGCSNLFSVSVPNSVSSIGNRAFYGASHIFYYGSATGSPWGASYHNKYIEDSIIYNDLTKTHILCCNKLVDTVTIPNSVASIEAQAFDGCNNITTIVVPNSVTSIGRLAFFHIPHVIYNGTATGSPWNALCVNGYVEDSLIYLNSSKLQVRAAHRKATSLSIPNSVTSIRDNAFEYCRSLSSVTIPNTVTSIGSNAFEYCISLSSITIPSSVTSIGSGSFKDCSNLSEIHMERDTPPTAGSGLFNGINPQCILYIPCGSRVAYANWYTNIFPDERRFEDVPYGVVIEANFPERGSIVNSYDCETYDATMTAYASYGYHFSQWNDGDTNNPRTVHVTTPDTAFVAIFEPNSYAVTLSCDPLQGSMQGAGSFLYRDTVTIAATAGYGYHFSQWSDGDTNNPRSFVLTRDTLFTALFAPDLFTLTLTCDNSQGVVFGSGTYTYLSEATISAIPINNSYEFSHWSDGDTLPSRTITITQDSTLEAIFHVGHHTLSLSCNPQQGSVSGAGSYLHGSTVTITATPLPNYHFLRWSDGDMSNPRQVTLWNDLSLSALFEGDLYQVTLNCDPEQGTVYGGGAYPYGTQVTFMASPQRGFHFLRWNDGVSDTIRTLTVTQDVAFTAYFGRNTYHYDVQPNNPEWGTVTGSGDYLFGDTVTMTATPAEGCTFDIWSDGNTSNPRVEVVRNSRSYTANFFDPSLNGITTVGDGASPRLYPNPASTSVTVEGYEGEVQIIDIQGRVVRTQLITHHSSLITLSGHPSGLYFVKCGTEVQKLIVK